MLWFLLSLATAFVNATEVTVVKRFLSDLRPLEIMAYPMAYSLPLFALGAAFISPTQILPGFWTTLAILLPINALGYYFSLRAVTISPLSLTMPFQALTPLVVLFTGLVFLGEVPTALGACGIVSIGVGSYVLGLSAGSRSLLGPFKAILKERGSVYMILAAVIFGLCAVMGKQLILASSPFFAAFTFFLIHNSLLLALFFLAKKVSPRDLLKRPRTGAAVGAMMFAHIFFHYSAISLVAAAYMISIKRLSALFSVIYGGLVFKEEHIFARLAGAAFMTAGAVIIVVWG